MIINEYINNKLNQIKREMYYFFLLFLSFQFELKTTFISSILQQSNKLL